MGDNGAKGGSAVTSIHHWFLRGNFREARRAVSHLAGTEHQVMAAHLALWEGDESTAWALLREVEEGALHGPLALEAAALFLALGRPSPVLPLLQRAASSPELATRCEILEAQRLARTGERRLALLRLQNARSCLGPDPAAWADYLWTALLLGGRFEPAAPPAELATLPGLQVLAAVLQAQAARWNGGDLARPLQEALETCTAAGMAGLLYRLISAQPDLFLTGLEAGIASPLYGLLWPPLQEEQLSRLAMLAADSSRPTPVRQVALELLNQRPDHPVAQQVIREVAPALSPGLSQAGLDEEPMLELTTYGRFALIRQGRVLSQGWPKKAQVLFVLLLGYEGRPVSRRRIAERLWPDLDPSAASNNLRVTIHKLRQRLALCGGPAGEHDPSDWMIAEGDQLRLAGTERIRWDAKQVERRIETARRCRRDGREDAALLALAPIASLCREPFLPDPAFDGLLDQERYRYDRLAQEALVDLAATALDQGRGEEALAAAEGALRYDPLDEPAHLLVMQAHAALGYPQRSLEIYRRYEALCAREMGCSPSRTLLQWISRILSA